MNAKLPLTALSTLLLLSGCADIIEGRSQEVTVQTNPPGAVCTIFRKDQPLGTVVAPGTVYLEKTKDELVIRCSKDGYQTSSMVDPSGYPKYNWAYILIGGPVGWGVDSASGADNLYTSPVTLDLVKTK